MKQLENNDNDHFFEDLKIDMETIRIQKLRIERLLTQLEEENFQLKV